MDEEGPKDNDYIAKLIRNILEWKTHPPSTVQYLLGLPMQLIMPIIQKMIPRSAILAALSGFDWAAKCTLTMPGSPDFSSVKSCDRCADQVINFHIGIAMAEGGAAGFFGLPAMVFDIPAVIWLAMRMIRQVGREYGYDEDTEAEQQFVFSIMAAASANSQEEKLAAMAMNAYLLNLISKTTWKAMAARAAATTCGSMTPASRPIRQVPILGARHAWYLTHPLLQPIKPVHVFPESLECVAPFGARRRPAGPNSNGPLFRRCSRHPIRPAPIRTPEVLDEPSPRTVL